MPHKPPSRIITLATFTLIVLLAPQLTFAQCCTGNGASDECRKRAEAYTESFKRMTASPLFSAFPEPQRKDLEDQLKKIKEQDSKLQKAFVREIKSYIKWLEPNEGPRSTCVSAPYIGIDSLENDLFWVVETVTLYKDIKAYSPEFCRGWRFHVEAGGGVKDLGATSESFMGSLGVLASYTFAPTDADVNIDTNYNKPHCNGRFRLAGGIAESYVDRGGLTQGLLRMEYKLFDLKTGFFSLGNFKAIGQGAFGLNRDFHTIGLGLGAETEIFGVNLVYGIGLEEVKSTLQLSFIYNTKLIKR